MASSGEVSLEQSMIPAMHHSDGELLRGGNMNSELSYKEQTTKLELNNKW